MKDEGFYRGARVLITGGLGMIGSTLACKLVAGGAHVTILDALLPHLGGNLFNIAAITDKVDLVTGDIRDANLVRKIVCDKDVIFNLAAQVSYTDSMVDPLLDLDINCRGQLVLLEACRVHNPKVKVVFTGSRLQYGRVPVGPVDEKVPNEPMMFYGVHKLAGEKYHLLYNRVYGMRTVVARITNPYGPRHHMKHSKYGIINWFVRLAMDGETIRVFGKGDQLRDYIHVEDTADALLALGSTDSTDGEVFNVGSGIPTSFSSMVKLVLEVVGSGRCEFVPWPKDYESTESGDFVANVDKIISFTGWRSSVPLADGIRSTHEYYVQNGEHYWRIAPDRSKVAVAGANKL